MKNPKQQGGVLISTVVVMIMLLVLMSTFLLTLQGIPQLSTSLSQQSIQAWFSAYSGMQWAVNDALHNNAANLSCDSPGPSFTLAGGSTEGFNVTVNCVSISVTEGTDTYTVYVLEVTAWKGHLNRSDYVTRTLRWTIRAP